MFMMQFAMEFISVPPSPKGSLFGLIDVALVAIRDVLVPSSIHEVSSQHQVVELWPEVSCRVVET
jgi:hypothetical protein